MKMLNSNLQDKSVLFITTKNISYIRNTQEIALIEKLSSEFTIIGSENRSYFIRMLIVYFRLLFLSVRSFDVVFVGFAPQLIVPFFSWKFRKKFLIIDFFISVYDTMVDDRKKFRPGSLFAAITHKLDDKTISKADLVISDTKAHVDFFVSEFNSEARKFEVLYLEADKKIYRPDLYIEKESTDMDNYLVLYFGSVLPLQGLDTILDAVYLLKENRNISFEIIGPVNKDDKIRFEGIKQVKFISWLSQAALAQHIAKADLCLAGHFNPDIGKAVRTIPGKAYIYEAMQKKIVLGENAANRELFCEDERHIFVKMGDSRKLAEVIKNESGY